MVKSIELGDDLMDIVGREAAIQGRSLADQISHWVRIGHAMEKSGRFNYARVVAALAGDLATVNLTAEEKEVWLDAFTERMAEPGPGEEAFFAQRQQASAAKSPRRHDREQDGDERQ